MSAASRTDKHTLNLTSLTEKLSTSRQARKLALVVLCVLFIVQMFIYMPIVWSQYNNSITSLVDRERADLQRIILLNSQPAQLQPENIITDTMLGVLVTDSAGNAVLTQGEIPNFSDLTVSGNELSSNRTGSVDALWLMESEGGRVLATARISTVDEFKSTILAGLGFTLASLLISLLGAALTLIGTNRSYIKPLISLVDKLRESRISSAGSIPEKIEFAEAEDLNILAEEFNNLIEAQQKSARQVKVKQQYLEFAAHHDPLTHLPNRLMFEDALKRTVSEAVKNDQSFVVFLVDLDNFKFFNDQYGHLVGDKMVAEIGNRLQTMMRDIDLVARLDGDEFVVIQKNVDDQAENRYPNTPGNWGGSLGSMEAPNGRFYFTGSVCTCS